MTKYDIRARADGQTDVIEMREMVLGSFAETVHAEAFLKMLNGQIVVVSEALDEAGQPVTLKIPQSTVQATGDSVELASPSPQQIEICPEQESSAEEAEPAQFPAPSRRAKRDDPGEEDHKPLPPPAAKLDASPEDLKAAFGLIDGGAKLKEVAELYGWPWHSLRGLWANEVRHRQKEIASAGPVNCSICSREFTPSVSSPDLCARCAKD